MPSIGIVVLAAGRSTRFAGGTGSKLLASVRGTPLVRLAVAAAIDADVGDVVVVTGHQSAEVHQALAAMPARIVNEPRFADGMALSLACGIRAHGASDAVMIGLGDQPGMQPNAYRRIAQRWRSTGARIVVPRYAESTAPSHPTLFDASLFDELLLLRGDVGARSVIARHAGEVVEERLAWTAPDDVDTLEDLSEVAERLPHPEPSAKPTITTREESR
jgi:molybdenum cofactor cytidylyltransferase